MQIRNLRGTTLTEAEGLFRNMSDAELLAQELTQKGAIHALETMLARAMNPRDMLESLQRVGHLISAECRRRKLPVADEFET